MGHLVGLSRHLYISSRDPSQGTAASTRAHLHRILALAPPRRAAITSGAHRIAPTSTVIGPLLDPCARYKLHSCFGASG